MTGFEYKPEKPKTDRVAAEIFLYDAGVLLTAMDELMEKEGKLEDYGDQLIPYLVRTEKVAEHRLDGYWRDMGTPESYHQGHMDLIDGRGLVFDDPKWPILSAAPRRLPGYVGDGARVAGSLLAPGSRVEGAVRRSVIGPGALVEAGADVESCVILGDVRISSGARLRNAIVDAGAVIGGGTELDGAQLDPEAGVVVVGAGGSVDTPPAS
ncbi:sugar phosphate nucleotidyltransferase [Arthrobacter sp. ATA002]|uniref:sugar phosphate nucleotidyltransferase n=1 Tax=Arthrobacter sp. ATA002 TaxID=2991715 RepID=UPI002E2F55FC|nr:sugar phosphate nucleotidyltransferase [Arthrobacter sp. ATA002]